MTLDASALPASRDEIATLIPHQGVMCLLDEVREWTPDGIVCTTRSHATVSHPLARDGRLAAVHLCEYGAQAAAVHGGLIARSQGAVARPGLLVALRDVQLNIVEVSPDGLLEVQAHRIQISETGWQYEFSVKRETRVLAKGRVVVMGGRNA